ncbi:phospholipase D family protein [Klebsiella aerogenes]|uniref:phospholipase D family nuclease n=1 Tax=Enterobacteriaceae TaxID=543 RepID=UPI001330D634|nr:MULTISPECIES: phospholipase D family protein [Enterobacteriaceae]MBX9001895.1 phospholipase D family protein [Klebsiella aerogenes]MCL9895816.1 phospholipase D family protein [Enterobacter hormaechei]MCM7653714.1 phospholipase D family protein [Enterobacter hormaechei]HCM9429377.1 phospholipase D family protein [Enterobacter hormaechei subsp. xiangfangensis]
MFNVDVRYLRPLFVAGLFCVSLKLNASPVVDVGFSPEGTAQQLVIQTLKSAGNNIRLMGYTFTSPEIVRELVRAKRRGIDVRVVLDDEGNRGRGSQAAINTLLNAGIPLRTVSTFRIMHDKAIIVDNKTVSTGSFNYTRSAARYNSENVIVIRDFPSLAQKYLEHWQSRWSAGQDQHLSY